MSIPSPLSLTAITKIPLVLSVEYYNSLSSIHTVISPKTLPNHLNDSQASAFNICFDSLPLHFLRSLFTPHTACVLLNKFDVNEFDASMPTTRRVRASSLICCMLCMIYSMANIVKCMKIRFPNYTLHIYSCIR